MLIYWRISNLEQRRSARKKRRFSIEQIVVVLKQAEIGLAFLNLSGSWGFLSMPFILEKVI